MAFALLLTIALITVATLALFLVHPWWLPVLASAQGVAVDHQFTVALIWISVAFVLAQLALGWFVWKYRSSSMPTGATVSSGNIKIEIIWTALIALLFLALGWTGAHSWAKSQSIKSAQKPIEVEVTAEQFAWYFRYPGADGVFGRTRPELQDASMGSRAALGLDPQDPASRDDVVTAQLVLPINREAGLTLRAHDVIHSFFVPELRFKQDAVPGMSNSIRFTPNRAGSYEIVCSQLCGLGHYKMRAFMSIVSESEYEKWLREHETSGNVALNSE